MSLLTLGIVTVAMSQVQNHRYITQVMIHEFHVTCGPPRTFLSFSDGWDDNDNLNRNIHFIFDF